MLDLNKVARNGRALRNFVDNYHRMPGGEELVEQLIQNEVEAVKDHLYTDMTWIDYYFSDSPYKDRIEQAARDQVDYISLKYVPSIWTRYEVGHTKEDGDHKYIYLGEAPGISEEIEIQAEDQSLHYLYIGHSYFEVWLTLEKEECPT